MKHGPGHFFDIENISQNYELVIADFDRINKIIRCKRDKFDRVIAGNMLHAYNHINNLLAAAPEKAILSWQDMLELNIVVHLGIQPESSTLAKIDRVHWLRWMRNIGSFSTIS